MVKIVIEAAKKETPECVFLNCILHQLGWKDDSFDILCANGYKNILSETILNQLQANILEGGRNLVVFDADYPSNGGGYSTRREWLDKELGQRGVQYDLFLWPDNNHDGDVESLMEVLARKDLYSEYFDCFEKFEHCLSNRKKSDGVTPFYTSPNLKAKLYAYVSSLPMSNSKKSKIGHGQWQFDNPDIWAIEKTATMPIGVFLLKYKPVI